MSDCLFCKIIAGDIPSQTIFENEHVLGFKDLQPQAPHHVLFIPKQHISTINDINQKNSHLVGELYLAAAAYGKEIGEAETGYRVVMNCNAGAGQSVYHIHLHFLAGRSLSWPPG